MNKPVIEIVIECEHGSVDQHETPECWGHERTHKSTIECYCTGGHRVRYSRQEAIDRIVASYTRPGYDAAAMPSYRESAVSAIDRLLGASE